MKMRLIDRVEVIFHAGMLGAIVGGVIVFLVWLSMQPFPPR